MAFPTTCLCEEAMMMRRNLQFGALAVLVLSLTGCGSGDGGSNDSDSNDDALRSAAKVQVTASATPASAQAGTEVDITLNVTTQRSVTSDIKLTVYAPNGSSAYTGAWPSQQLTPGTPLVLTEAIIVESSDP